MKPLTSSMKLCYSDTQKLGEKPLPFTADMPRQSSLTLLKMHKASAIWTAQLCKGMAAFLQWRAASGCSKISWGKAAPSPATLVLGDALGKKAFSAAKDHFPWEGPAFINFLLQKDPPLQNFKSVCRRHLTAWAVITKVPLPQEPGWAIVTQHILHFLSQKDTPSI